MRPVIKSVKHFTHTPVAAITSGSRLVIGVVDAVAEGAALGASSTVWEGAIVKAVYIEFWIASATALFTASWCVVKRPASVAAPTAAEMGNLGAYENKKNIFDTGQGLVPSNGNIMNIYKTWVKIPKGKQRFGLGDQLNLIINSVGATISVCGLTIFKEYK